MFNLTLSGHSLFMFTDPYEEHSEEDNESEEESSDVGTEGAENDGRGGFLGRTRWDCVSR